MAKRGGPRSPKAASATIVDVKMRLYSGEDDDLIDFFASIPRRLRAGIVKQAPRSGTQGIAHDIPTAEDEVLEPLAAPVD
jgi:hypothetical protein